MERLPIIAAIIKAASTGDEAQVKHSFEKLCAMSNCKTKGKQVDLNAINVRVADLIEKITEDESLTSSLATIGAIFGLEVVEVPEEGNGEELVQN